MTRDITLAELTDVARAEGLRIVEGPAAEPPGTAAIIRALASRDITVREEKRLSAGRALHLSDCPFYPNETHTTAASLLAWDHGGIAFRCFGGRCKKSRTGLLALLELLDLQPIAEATDGIVRLIDAVSVRTQAAEFTWGGRIVLNDLNAAVGDEKIGKGVLLIWLIAQLTTGRMTGEPVTVVYASTEENLERIVKPRLMAAGAVLERVRFLPMGPVGLPEALPELTRAMVDAGASFLFLDPINEHFSQGLDPNKAKDVAAVLGKLAIAATEYGITLIGSLHTNRSGGLTSRERLAHQIQFRRSLRSGLLIGRTDDDEDGDRTIVHDFSNYAETAPALKARIHGEVVETDDGRLATYPVLTVGDETDATAEDIFLKDADREGAISKAKDERGRRGQVAQNILGRWRSLGHPSEVLASEMTVVTKDVPAGTLSRARASLGIETVADRDPATGQVRGHVWLFPPALLER